ncbi:MAG: sugar phosphate isomerase/epimerase family protein [Planctomycetota bacterium]
MPFGVFTVSTPDYEPLPLLDRLADLGYDGVEWRVIDRDTGDRSAPSFWSGNRTSMTPAELLDAAPAIRERADALGLAMPSIGSYVGNESPDAVEPYCRAAQAIGAVNVRVGPGGYDAEGRYLDQVTAARARYAALEPLAERYGGRLCVETHGGQLGPSVTKALRLLDGLDPARFGILWDPGNQVGEGLERYDMALDALGSYLAEVHVKNRRPLPTERAEDGHLGWTVETCALRDGMVPWPEVVALLRARGYDGWLVFEDFSTDLPLDERLADNLAWFRALQGD